MSIRVLRVQTVTKSCKIKNRYCFNNVYILPYICKRTLNFIAIYDGYLVVNEVPKEIINEMSINYKLKHVNRQSVFTYDFRLVPGL